MCQLLGVLGIPLHTSDEAEIRESEHLVEDLAARLIEIASLVEHGSGGLPVALCRRLQGTSAQGSRPHVGGHVFGERQAEGEPPPRLAHVAMCAPEPLECRDGSKGGLGASRCETPVECGPDVVELRLQSLEPSTLVWPG